MSEFTEKLRSSEPVSRAWDEIDRGQASAGLLIDTISDEFKDWKLPKALPEVPQCVDDAIKALPDYYSVYGAIEWIRAEIIEFEEEKEDWIDVYNWIFKENNANKFAMAWLDGYTVEKEQLYIIKLPLPEWHEHYYAVVDFEGMICEDYFPSNYKLTESEIKAIDERYLAFAVPVDEVEP